MPPQRHAHFPPCLLFFLRLTAHWAVTADEHEDDGAMLFRNQDGQAMNIFLEGYEGKQVWNCGVRRMRATSGGEKVPVNIVVCCALLGSLLCARNNGACFCNTATPCLHQSTFFNTSPPTRKYICFNRPPHFGHFQHGMHQHSSTTLGTGSLQEFQYGMHQHRLCRPRLSFTAPSLQTGPTCALNWPPPGTKGLLFVRGAQLDRGPKICWPKHGGLSATAAQAALLLVEVPDIQFELFFEIIHPMSAWHTEPVSPLIG